MFASAADNLIQNALAKRRQQVGLPISVSFVCGDTLRLEVSDAGKAMAKQIAAELLREPVSSDSGLGIGLYQVARHAETCGYALALAHNADGRVCFILSGPVRAAAELTAIPSV